MDRCPLDIILKIALMTDHAPSVLAMACVNKQFSKILKGKRRERAMRKFTECMIVDTKGTKCWTLNGKKHRENDQPAVVRRDGTKGWWVNGKLHRENDQPAVVRSDGSKMWYINGKWYKRRLRTWFSELEKKK